MIIDTHTHLNWESFKDDLPEVLKRAREAGVETVINVGADLEGSEESAKLDLTPLASFSTIGLHPHEVLKLSTDVSPPATRLEPSGDWRAGIHECINKLERIYNKYPNKVIAVGECGLDYHFAGIDYSPSQIPEDEQKVLQKKLFLAQIELAKKLNLPLVIHNRDAWDDIFVPELSGTRGVFHSFTGDLEQAQKVLDMGYYLGFTCVVTYPKNDLLRQVIAKTPLEKILTETDCPFLPPQLIRGQRNEPANVCEVVKVISEVKNIPYEEVAQVTSENASQLFGFNLKGD